MTVKPIVGIVGMRIEGASSPGLSGFLDPIHVYWENVATGSGYVTIISYGEAWTQYFGAMSGRTIQEFFVAADENYLVNALGNKPSLRQGQRATIHLTRIVQAIREALKRNGDEGITRCLKGESE